MTEQLSDHREALAQGQRPGSIRMPKVIKTHVAELGIAADAVSLVVDVAQCLARLGAPASPTDCRLFRNTGGEVRVLQRRSRIWFGSATPDMG